MNIKSLSISNLRCFDHIRFKPGTRINLITGLSGSGKTSILEAIYLLCRGRSFRTNQVDRLQNINNSNGKLYVYADLISPSGLPHSIKFNFNPNISILIDAKPIDKLSSLVNFVPSQVISTAGIFSFFSCRKERLSIIDWLLFHVKPDFHLCVHRYSRILKQRNEALKIGNSRLIQSFKDEFIYFSEKIDNDRNDITEQISSTLSTDIKLIIKYYSGWNKKKHYHNH